MISKVGSSAAVAAAALDKRTAVSANDTRCTIVIPRPVACTALLIFSYEPSSVPGSKSIAKLACLAHLGDHPGMSDLQNEPLYPPLLTCRPCLGQPPPQWDRQRRAHTGATTLYAKDIGGVGVRCDIHGRASPTSPHVPQDARDRVARLGHRQQISAWPDRATVT